MKNVLVISTIEEELLSNIDDGTNRLFINGSEIDSSNWVGTGNYTATIEGHSVTIKKIDSLSGNISLSRVFDYSYEMSRRTPSSSVSVQSIEQTTTSHEDGGTNIVTCTLTDGTETEFQILNGQKGSQGQQGATGATGAAAGFGTPTASVDANVGTPSVTVTATGADTAKVFDFAFHNLKGEYATVDSTLSDTSINPVQNKVVKSALDGKLDTTGKAADSAKSDAVTMNNSNLIRFGVDSSGNYGYIKAGADTVIPFSKATIFGASWAGGASSAFTRTDSAVGITEPNPYYAGMSPVNARSFFDGVYPWAEIRVIDDTQAGVLVEIPKFWYKWTRSGSAMQIQISDKPVNGFLISPAHADRGDGVGERDYVYIGRYKSGYSNAKSISGNSLSKAGISTYRTRIHNLGSDVWQQDFALYWSIRMLYLVEFADWNVQTKIGFGNYDSSAESATATGTTDAMPYHTGTMKSSRSTMGTGVQYRHIEDIWANHSAYVDGIYPVSGVLYGAKNPANFGRGTSYYTRLGNYSYGNGCITSYTANPTEAGYEYAIFPQSNNQTYSYGSYICDKVESRAVSSQVYEISGGWAGSSPDNKASGMFGIGAYYSTGTSNGAARLMKLPSGRL